jgi:hypothetical protein
MDTDIHPVKSKRLLQFADKKTASPSRQGEGRVKVSPGFTGDQFSAETRVKAFQALADTFSLEYRQPALPAPHP